MIRVRFWNPSINNNRSIRNVVSIVNMKDYIEFMIMKIIAMTLLVFCLSKITEVSAQQTSDTKGEGLVELYDNLDEPRGLCFDIAGFRASIDYHIPLQAHTCKPDPDNREDGLFVIDFPQVGNIYNRTYDKCLDAISIVERGNVFMRPCQDAVSQKFDFADHFIAITDNDNKKLCLGVSPSPSHPSVLAGTEPEEGITFVARTMAFVACDSVDRKFIQWRLPT